MATMERTDHAGDIHWFIGYGPTTPTGSCPHTDCPHAGNLWVAYGPDLEHYTLNQCPQCGCRAWFNETGRRRTRWLAH